MGWFKKDDGSLSPEEQRRNKSDFEVDPAKLKEEITKDFNEGFGKFQSEQDEKLKPVLSFVEEMRKQNDERKAEEKRIADAKKAKENEIEDTDWMLDPSAAIDKKLAPTQNAVLSLAARAARHEILNEKEYYHGDIKTKVDQMISAQPLTQQHNANVIENCYKLVMFDHQKDIAEGKIKARNNSASFNSDGTGGHSGKESKDGEEVMSADEKQAASALGISEVDWKKSRKELTYV